MIIELELPPGARFTEPQLAARCGTSKTPVREALVRLQRDGLVQAVARSGYRVTPVTLKNTRDLCEFRTLLACVAAERAAAQGVPGSVIDQLQRINEGLQADYGDDPSRLAEYVKASMQFELIIASFSGNDRLFAVHSELSGELERVVNLSVRIFPWSSTAAAQRQRIIDAIRARDPKLAGAAMRERTEYFQSRILSALMESSSIETASIQLP